MFRGQTEHPRGMLGKKHTVETRAAIGAWSRGLPKSESQRMKMRESQKAHALQCRGRCGSVGCTRPTNPSKLAWRAYETFLQDFEVVIPEEHFGPYSVDFLLAEEWLAIEVDGEYWHQFNNTDYEARDKFLLEAFELPVVRLTESDVPWHG